MGGNTNKEGGSVGDYDTFVLWAGDKNKENPKCKGIEERKQMQEKCMERIDILKGYI